MVVVKSTTRNSSKILVIPLVPFGKSGQAALNQACHCRPAETITDPAVVDGIPDVLMGDKANFVGQKSK